jgi:type II secretory pathway component PulJ
MTRRTEAGTALLEALVALAILAATGISTVGVLQAALRSEWTLRERERRFDRADRVLAAMSLLAAGDLDRRLGDHRIGEFMARVQRPEPGLYRISMGDTVPASAELLVTVVYRPRDGRP